MDLREAGGLEDRRHPWELSRVVAVRRVLNNTITDGLSVLDLGCGDGFLSRALFKGTGALVTAVDSNFTAKHLAVFNGRDRNIVYSKSVKGDERFGLVLLLDVIEHVDRDTVFLKKIVRERLADGGRVLITVPAFNALFSGHDRFLGHRRRYSLKELSALAEKAGLRIVSRGYLFSTLLLPRALKVASEKALGRRVKKAEGIGNWRYGSTVTFLVKVALDMDNTICLALNRLGIRLPGLTGWVLCERQR